MERLVFRPLALLVRLLPSDPQRHQSLNSLLKRPLLLSLSLIDRLPQQLQRQSRSSRQQSLSPPSRRQSQRQSRSCRQQSLSQPSQLLSHQHSQRLNPLSKLQERTWRDIRTFMCEELSPGGITLILARKKVAYGRANQDSKALPLYTWSFIQKWREQRWIHGCTTSCLARRKQDFGLVRFLLMKPRNFTWTRTPILERMGLQMDGNTTSTLADTRTASGLVTSLQMECSVLNL